MWSIKQPKIVSRGPSGLEADTGELEAGHRSLGWRSSALADAACSSQVEIVLAAAGGKRLRLEPLLAR